MTRRRTDAVVSALLAVTLVGGGALTWQAYRQARALDQSMGSMMDGSMGAMHGPNPLWYAFGTLLLAGAIGGAYLLLREANVASDAATNETRSEVRATTAGDPGATTAGDPEPTETESQSVGSSNPEADPQARVLDLLPDDERRVLKPVLASPGITQIELRDRSEFSKSKVSQTVSSLEERGLLYRERQGRTYRVYPSEDLRKHHTEA
ncbi:hypothetical protein C461_09627 [Halorubrum aidingense JCM 13560]|uniref:DUF7343 domain-containing protein n=1 Tax=Halorubrum aidingense JCM 13560 TaxID=1230454 RepID=M0PB05_9EURY|nr:MarR family transcriptional regulator [Halorubrum aidingense]EMA67008.1 hypothetical protein C461_09627 [Halorubrum aidingense JCM 13560]